VSEHRRPPRGGAKIIPLPRPEEEIYWPLREQMNHYRRYIDSGRQGIEGLFSAQEGSFELLALVWGHMHPRLQQAVVRRLAPAWAKLNAMIAANAERASAMARRRAER
jgi:hypothetical protein